jgi:NADH-quinone oxidoreductase subunit N
VVRDANGVEDTDMARWAGLGRRYPLVGVVFSLFLLAFAGIPLTSGFVSKFAVFKAAGQGGAIPLVVVGVIASAIAAYFYVRVIVLMFFTDPPEDAPEVVTPSALSVATITLTAAITFALGALPQPLLDLVDHAARFLD